ncbi:hypothetical protein BR93DRAFT_72492 [Coniochaeta sp. PMI_546]|nr:hypothetical protein BR93DRAFT_72492 [Coniochaeta sp. PMI_546]
MEALTHHYGPGGHTFTYIVQLWWLKVLIWSIPICVSVRVACSLAAPPHLLFTTTSCSAWPNFPLTKPSFPSSGLLRYYLQTSQLSRGIP